MADKDECKLQLALVNKKARGYQLAQKVFLIWFFTLPGCRVGPKIALDHVRVYKKKKTMFVRFGFPHHWLYTMLLTTHLR